MFKNGDLIIINQSDVGLVLDRDKCDDAHWFYLVLTHDSGVSDKRWIAEKFISLVLKK